MDQIVNRNDERRRQDHRHVLREEMHEVEPRASHRQRKPHLFAPAEVAAVAERDVFELRRDSRQPRDELARVGFHAGRHLTRQARIEPDARPRSREKALFAPRRGIDGRLVCDVPAARTVQQRPASEQQPRETRRYAGKCGGPSRRNADPRDRPSPPATYTDRIWRDTCACRDTNSAATFPRGRRRCPRIAHASCSGASLAAAGCACSATRARPEEPHERLALPDAHRFSAEVRRSPQTIGVDVVRRARRSHRATRHRALRPRRSSTPTASSPGTVRSGAHRRNRSTPAERRARRHRARTARCDPRDPRPSTNTAMPRGRLVSARGRLRSSSRVRTTAVIRPGSRTLPRQRRCATAAIAHLRARSAAPMKSR